MSLRDVHVYGGLGVAALGGAWISWPWMLVGLGFVLVLMGLFLPRRP